METAVANQRVVVVGGGVGGLCAALALGRAGYEVVVVERDPLPTTADAEEAFVAERRGAPQVHQTRFWNLLATPAEMLGDAAVMARMAEVMADPDAWPVPERVGPKRSELLAALAAHATAKSTEASVA